MGRIDRGRWLAAAAACAWTDLAICQRCSELEVSQPDRQQNDIIVGQRNGEIELSGQRQG